jgi:hypothetical protein
MSFPLDRKGVPIYSGFVKIFPDAMAAIAQLTALATPQHNPGEPVGWDKTKSMDELDAFMRHMTDTVMAGDPAARDKDGALHAVKMGWRSMANLQRLADAGVNIFATPAGGLPGYSVDVEEDWRPDERLVTEPAIRKFAMREA